MKLYTKLIQQSIHIALLSTISYTTAYAADSFMIDIRNKNHGVYQITCKEVVGKTHYYGTNTLTTTHDNYWKCSNEADCAANKWRLSFHREDTSNAFGGRCSTNLTPTISGNGVFSARLYIHSNVQNSPGVFTIAATPTPFVQSEELDLIVINVENNTAKSGNPGIAASVELNAISNRWISIIMQKTGNNCTTTIEREGASTLNLGTVYCQMSPTQSQIIINSRARDLENYDYAFISIEQVKWVAK